MTQKSLNRFWSKVRKTRGCWLWTTGKDKDGYGKTCINRKDLRAHRVSYEITYGKIPKGMGVLHKCDNPSCVNPKHLFIGTAKDNAVDMMKKGRRSTVLIGETHPSSKLTARKISMIRKMLSENSGYGSGRSIAKKFNVSDALISNIKHNSSWKHIKS